MTRRRHPYRRTTVAVGALTAAGGYAGTWQLVAGVATPPDTDLPPGLHSWVLPGLWLCATVAVPWTVATWLTWRRSDRAPAAVLVACSTLAVELAVQIPFVGLNLLQVVFGAVAVALAGMALEGRRALNHPPARPATPAETTSIPANPDAVPAACRTNGPRLPPPVRGRQEPPVETRKP
jgi:hypothetical protein